MTTDAQWVESMPEVYDRCLGPALFMPFAEHLGRRAAQLSPPPLEVLELAAGTGLLTARLVSELPGAHIVATDLNAAMVRWAADRVPGAEWATADATQLDYPNASFDLVICQFGVMFFPDKAAGFAETARVLRPGASFLFTTWDVVAGTSVAAALVDSLAAVFPDAPPDFVSRIPHGYADPEQIAADLEGGGLTCTSLERVVLHGPAESARTVAEGFGFGTPLRFALEERGTLADLVSALGDEMTERLGPGPVDGRLTAFVGTAVRQH